MTQRPFNHTSLETKWGGPYEMFMCMVQVRRRADSAKNLVKEWLTEWRDSPLVAQDPSHSQIRGKDP